MQPHVFFQSLVAAECGRALLASVVHLTCVSVAMANERFLEFEPLATHVTLVRSLAGVRQNVILKRITACKRCWAQLASVVHLTCVDAVMLDERLLEFEPLAAHITFVRSLLGVCQNVIIKPITGCKRHRAVVALEQLLTRVGTLMLDETLPPHEPRPARGACVSLPAKVHCLGTLLR